MLAAALDAAPRWRKPRFVLGAGSLLLACEIVVVSLAASNSSHDGALRLALAADTLLITGLAVWLAGGPRALGLTPSKAIRTAVLGIFLFSLIQRGLGLASEGVLLVLAALAELSLIGFVIASLVWAARQPGDAWERAQARLVFVLPEPVAQVVLMEFRLVHAALQAMARRPLARPPVSAEVFRPLEASRSGWLLPFILIASAVEMPALHLLLHIFAPGRAWPHALLLGLNGYGVLWLVGERRLMWSSEHRFEADALALRLGMRFEARLPYALISSALQLRGYLERRSVQPRTGKPNPQVTPFDAPNVHLCLSEPVTFTTFFGLKRWTQHLDLFVDRPEVFLATLEARRGARQLHELVLPR